MPLTQTLRMLTGAVPVKYATLLLKLTAESRTNPPAFTDGKLGGDAVPGLRKPGFDGGVGVLHTQAIRHEGVVLGIQQRPALGDVQRPIDQLLQGAPIHPPERGLVVDVRCVRVLAVDRERFWPGPQEPLLPITMLKSNISSEYRVPPAPM